MSRTRTLVIGAFTLTCGASLNAIHESKNSPMKPVMAEPELRRVPDPSHRLATTPSLRVENMRLEAALSTETEPSTTMKFDLVNAGPERLTDVLLEISITEKPAVDLLTPRRTLVRPFQIRGDVVLESGYTIAYENAAAPVLIGLQLRRARRRAVGAFAARF